ncbi:hypothetical protein BC332_16789 [Capsicum chinense]|nr:hypothetical protein BC332_16789 [Capsicum chinense]
MTKTIYYEKDWIVDSGYSNHMTGDKKKLQHLSEDNGKQGSRNGEQLKVTDSSHWYEEKSSLCGIVNIFWLFCSIWTTRCEGISGPGYYRRTGDERTKWSSDKEVLPKSDVLKDVVQSSQIQLGLGEAKHVDDKDNVEEVETPTQLKKSTRFRKPNPKYANTAIVEEKGANEPEMFEEASQDQKWSKAMKEEMEALK